MTTLIRPLPLIYRISSDFGYRIHPITNAKSFHNGVDIAAPNGTNIRSAGNGKIIWCGENETYGKMVVVEHNNGILSLYAHMQKINVKNNYDIKTGDSIGEVGDTGKSKGNHLHYEIIDGNKEYNSIKIKDIIKSANNFKYKINEKKHLGIHSFVQRLDPKKYFNKKQYIWVAKKECKFSEIHIKYDKQKFSYDEILFPGEENNCFCCAEEINE